MKKMYVVTTLLLCVIAVLSFSNAHQDGGNLNNQLYAILQREGFTGEIEKQLEIKLGRKLDKRKVELGRLIFFDKGLGLHQDNSCAGCHAPGFGFGDSQPIAIGVDNNDTVGIHRRGARNQRRTPSVINTAFYPSLMWNSRFKSLTNDPFNNAQGFEFPAPEGDSLFSKTYSYVSRAKHLLVAQAHIPFTELPEMAGFTSTANKAIPFSRFSGLNTTNNKQPLVFNNNATARSGNAATCAEPDFSLFDDGYGLPVPAVDPHYNSQNFGIRAAVLNLLNTNAEYKRLFKNIYPQVAHQPIDFIMVGEVVAEFEFSLTFAKAPLDKFAVGNRNAMSESQKRGAIIFFRKGNCVSCHAVSGASNQMFSDFAEHNVGTPQIAPVFGYGSGNVPFSQLDCQTKTTTGTLDYGREEFTGNIADRYKFRSSPLRNAKLQSFFFHNGSFRDLKKAIKYHLDPKGNIAAYDPQNNGVPNDLKYRASDMSPVMATIDPALRSGIRLSDREIEDLYNFVNDGLYDDNAAPEKMNRLIPESVPSGVKLAFFERRANNHSRQGEPTGADAVIENNQLQAKLMANPTYNTFSMILPLGDKQTKTNLTITDANGVIIESRSFIANGQTIQFGQNYRKGIFFAVLAQGEKQIQFTLIKL